MLLDFKSLNYNQNFIIISLIASFSKNNFFKKYFIKYY